MEIGKKFGNITVKINISNLITLSNLEQKAIFVNVSKNLLKF